MISAFKVVQPAFNSDKNATIITNSRGVVSRHILITKDLTTGDFLNLEALDLTKIKLVIFDPPFGVTNDSWDKAWTKEHFRVLFNTLAEVLNFAPAIIFHSPSMIPELFKGIKESGYKYEYLYWQQV